MRKYSRMIFTKKYHTHAKVGPSTKKIGSSKSKFDVHRTLPDRGTPATLEIPRPPRPLWKRFLVGLTVLVLAFALFVGAWDAVNISRASSKLFGSSNLASLLLDDSLKNQDGRTNLLLVGYSVDDPGHPAADLTDSLLLISMNSENDNGYMLSIPRDLYIKIPGFGYGKINEVYKDGGIELLRSVVAEKLSVLVHYYALLNYAAVRDSVKALGGIDIEIKSTDPRGLYDPNISPVDGGPLKLPNGWQKLDGQVALNLTRARGDGPGSYGFAQADFDRTQNQRQVLTSIKNELSWTLVLNPLRNGQLFQAFANNIKTDLKLGEAKSLFSLFNSIPETKLQSLSLRNLGGKNLLASYSAPGGSSALVPAAGLENYLAVQTAIEQLNQ